LRAVLKGIHCADIPDLENYRPNTPDKFSFLLQLFVGSDSEEGAQSFGVTVCIPQSLLERYTKDDVIIGRHLLIIFEYDYRRIMGKIERFLRRCDGETWDEVARKVGELGHWEFENYKPH
jgi:hypothetical protein